jgi:hypothetical protein
MDRAILGVRYSAFFRVSGFGLRISSGRSAFPRRPMAVPFRLLGAVRFLRTREPYFINTLLQRGGGEGRSEGTASAVCQSTGNR